MNNIQKTKKVEESQPPVAKSGKNVKKSKRGGARPGAGRKPGSIQKLGGRELLIAIEKHTGKSFADNIAEHYHRAIVEGAWNDVRDYEKFIIAKVISDVQEVDITSKGESIVPNFQFTQKELPDWQNLPKTVKVSK